MSQSHAEKMLRHCCLLGNFANFMITSSRGTIATMDELLIAKVPHYSALYDQSTHDCNNNHQKTKIWETIDSKIGMTGKYFVIYIFNFE